MFSVSAARGWSGHDVPWSQAALDHPMPMNGVIIRLHPHFPPSQGYKGHWTMHPCPVRDTWGIMRLFVFAVVILKAKPSKLYWNHHEEAAAYFILLEMSSLRLRWRQGPLLPKGLFAFAYAVTNSMSRWALTRCTEIRIC